MISWLDSFAWLGLSVGLLSYPQSEVLPQVHLYPVLVCLQVARCRAHLSLGAFYLRATCRQLKVVYTTHHPQIIFRVPKVCINIFIGNHPVIGCIAVVCWQLCSHDLLVSFNLQDAINTSPNWVGGCGKSNWNHFGTMSQNGILYNLRPPSTQTHLVVRKSILHFTHHAFSRQLKVVYTHPPPTNHFPSAEGLHQHLHWQPSSHRLHCCCLLTALFPWRFGFF